MPHITEGNPGAGDPTDKGWIVRNLWPEASKPRIPDALPDQVARAFLVAEKNFPLEHHEEAAAGMYGRALDIGLKIYAPTEKGTLYERIKSLAAQHRLTDSLAEWAHEIRLIRNDAMHDIDSVNRQELEAIRGFTETLLTYIFSMPAMLKSRKPP
jgi:hypothetical protein